MRESGGTLLIAVADGVGGGPGGEIAAGAAVETLADRFFEAPEGLSLEVRLAEAIRDANTAVLRAAELSGKPQAASTLVAAAVRDDRAVIANLGDSRAYLVRDGAPRQVTEDHAASTAHGITRFVGDPRGVQPDVFVEDLRSGDRLVLCSDGLTRHVEPDEIAAHVAGLDVERAADELVKLANARGGEDNVTLVVHVPGPRAARAAPSRRAFALGFLTAVVAFVVISTVAALIALAPRLNAPASPSPSASASASPTPSPSESPSPSPSPSPTETPSATP